MRDVAKVMLHESGKVMAFGPAPAWVRYRDLEGPASEVWGRVAPRLMDGARIEEQVRGGWFPVSTQRRERLRRFEVTE